MLLTLGKKGIFVFFRILPLRKLVVDMNVLFVYSIQKSILKDKPLKGQEDIQLGIAQLSSVLKEDGHNTFLQILDRKYKKRNLAVLQKRIKENSIDLICFSSVYSEFDFIIEIGRFIKQNCNIFTVIGGVHVTLNPEEELLNVFDALCIGEGEYALAELANTLEKGNGIENIENLWIKQNGKVYKNKTRPFIQDLDTLPFVDRDIWQDHLFEPESRLSVMLGRGCPYNCTYCCNHKLKQVATGKYVRMRSVENIVAEIKNLTTKFPLIREYFLEVETLGVDIDWVLELCNELFLLNKSLEHKLAFGTNLRIFDTLDVDLIFKNLKKANFKSVTIGLESGNERIRREVLNRRYSNKSIVRAVKTAKKYQIDVGLFNLVGLPTETLNDFQDTLKLNQNVQPNWHATSIFFPYKGTRLFDMAKELGILPDKLEFKEERQHAVLDLPGFSRKQIQKQFDSFHYNVYKKGSNKSVVKTILFYAQIFLGHNFMANAKSRIIVILYRLGIRSQLLNTFQKV